MEIERKLLIKEIPDLTNTVYTEITQGYLSFDPEIRIRKDSDKYYITQKSNGDIAREEIEKEIDTITYNILSNLTRSIFLIHLTPVFQSLIFGLEKH